MIVSVPTSKYTDFYDIARFKLTWRINIILVLILPFLAVTLYLLGESAAGPSLIGLGMAFIMLVILKIKKTYFISAIIFSVTGTILSQWTLIFFPESYHFVDTMWILIVVLYTYFTLGKFWGIISLAVNLLGIIYYIYFGLAQNISLVKTLKIDDLTALSVNFVICSVIISYLINQFIRTSKHAENEYKQLNEVLKTANQEKTTMLKEIHHRVKNNLQVITSLLRLQSHEIEDEAHKKLYQESINRVGAMALIHEKMYQSENLAKIDLKEYIDSLAVDLLKSYSVDKLIKINVVSEIENIKNKSLVPLALIFNELISNSIKHAFENQNSGEINIDILNNQTHITLEYKDNGVWKTSTKENSFGLELIDALTEQLSGKFKRSVSNGTCYSFIFAPEN